MLKRDLPDRSAAIRAVYQQGRRPHGAADVAYRKHPAELPCFCCSLGENRRHAPSHARARQREPCRRRKNRLLTTTNNVVIEPNSSFLSWQSAGFSLYFAMVEFGLERFGTRRRPPSPAEPFTAPAAPYRSALSRRFVGGHKAIAIQRQLHRFIAQAARVQPNHSLVRFISSAWIKMSEASP